MTGSAFEVEILLGFFFLITGTIASIFIAQYYNKHAIIKLQERLVFDIALLTTALGQGLQVIARDCADLAEAQRGSGPLSQKVIGTTVEFYFGDIHDKIDKAFYTFMLDWNNTSVEKIKLAVQAIDHPIAERRIRLAAYNMAGGINLTDFLNDVSPIWGGIIASSKADIEGILCEELRKGTPAEQVTWRVRVVLEEVKRKAIQTIKRALDEHYSKHPH